MTDCKKMRSGLRWRAGYLLGFLLLAAVAAGQAALPVAFTRHYAGTLNGRYPVRMILVREGSRLSGNYHYLRHDVRLRLEGSIRGSNVMLREIYGSGTVTGIFRGRFTDDRTLDGTWSHPNGSGRIPFHLEEIAQPSAAPQAPAQAPAPGPFQGRWASLENGILFSLTLDQQGQNVVGYHCAVTRHARRIDCADREDGDQPTIQGTVVGNVATVTFRSAYSPGAGGTARITSLGRRVEWEILDSHGEFYLPVHAVLVFSPLPAPGAGSGPPAGRSSGGG